MRLVAFLHLEIASGITNDLSRLVEPLLLSIGRLRYWQSSGVPPLPYSPPL